MVAIKNTSFLLRMLLNQTTFLGKVFSPACRIFHNYSKPASRPPTLPLCQLTSMSCLNSCHAIALTPIIMNCSEKLIMRQIKTLLPLSLVPVALQYMYCSNDLKDYASATTLHLALTLLDKGRTHMFSGRLRTQILYLSKTGDKILLKIIIN